MKRKIRDRNEPIGKMKRVADFLPPPEELVLPEDTIKITLFLKKSSVDFFKQEAGKHRTRYQRMIRELLDKYAVRYSSV